MIKIKECRKFMKVCKDCEQLKLIKYFAKNKRMKDGRRNQCSKCLYNQNKNRYSHICKQCNKEYKNGAKESNFCSRKCLGLWNGKREKGKNNPRWQNNKVRVKCDYCGKEKILIPYYIENYKHHFCNKDCHKKWQLEYGEKGEKHPNYKDNKTKREREQGRRIEGYSRWVKNVYERDNYTCQITGKRGGDLEVHHLNNYSEYKEERMDVNNGVTLSKKIHKLFHHIYGYRHNTKEQFEEFKERYNNGEFKEVI